ncbi:hypothetical protein S245_067697, partial [Arachis hypogaea]
CLYSCLAGLICSLLVHIIKCQFCLVYSWFRAGSLLVYCLVYCCLLPSSICWYKGLLL